MAAIRLDQHLVALGLCPSRERASALILAGVVSVNGQVLTKAGTKVDPACEVLVREDPLPFVSRGGLKLRHALEHFQLDPKGVSALDVGASTGGFTDCLLQAGAQRVCAVDVGYGQLAWQLRSDPRVTVRERMNARYLTKDDLPFVPTFAVCDVSFISQTLILPRLFEVLASGSPVVTLVKPQFEVGKGQVGKGGVVRDPDLHKQVVERCREAAQSLGFAILGDTPSPILGPSGNVEFLLALRK